jgi:hypothetical protein
LPFACARVFDIRYNKRNGSTMATTRFKSTKGSISRHRCLLRRGIVEYAGTIRNNSIALRYPEAAEDRFIDATPDFLNTTAPQPDELVLGQYKGELIMWEYFLERQFAKEQVFVRIMGASEWVRVFDPCDPSRRNTNNKTDLEKFYGSEMMYQTKDYLHRDPMPVSNTLQTPPPLPPSPSPPLPPSPTQCPSLLLSPCIATCQPLYKISTRDVLLSNSHCIHNMISCFQLVLWCASNTINNENRISLAAYAASLCASPFSVPTY